MLTVQPVPSPATPKTKLDKIQQMQTRLSAALEMHCYPDEGFLAQLSMAIEHQLSELETLLEGESLSAP